jgi:hypothetical protein
MKKFLVAVFCSMMLIGGLADAASSSGGGSRGGFSSSGGSSRSFSSSSSAPRSTSTPTASPNRGGFNSQSTPKPATAAPTTRSTTTTTTTTNRSSSSSYGGGGYRYNSPYVGGGMMYGGWGMGYGYTNGLLTGMIIANMMHPYNTVMYTGGGQYSNNALLYPDGSVVNKQGYLVGNYVDGQFNSVSNGPMVAKSVPADANGEPIAQPQQQQQVAQPVIIQRSGPSAGEILLYILIGSGCVILFFILLGLL